MPGNARTAGIREFDRLFRQGTLLGRSEAELLDLFVCSRDEFAFEALVTRHGPMVLRTCRALLADPHDADDAFQATFLVLSRRAGSIRNAKLLGPWLHRVARRVCSRSIADSSRRSHLERPSTDTLATLAAPGASLSHADRVALHEAIDRLPERYRRVIILCDLEGHSHAEAAARLRCPIGTVKGRQSRARSLLRRRLTRLGLAPASLLSGTLVSLPTRAFGVPHTLIHRTSRTAATFALGSSLAPGTVPGVALSLATGVLSGMAAHQLKFTALVGFLALGLGSSGLAALRFAENGDGVPGIVSNLTQGQESDRPDDRQQTAPPHPAENSVAGLVGTWKLVTRGGGPPLPSDLWLTVSRVETPNSGSASVIRCAWTWSEGLSSPEDRITTSHLSQVDPAASPPSWDVHEAGAVQTRIGFHGRGIYRLDGDTLTLRFSESSDSPRPDDFDGPNAMVFVRLADDPEVPGVVPTPANDLRPDNEGMPGVVPPPATPAMTLLGSWKQNSHLRNRMVPFLAANIRAADSDLASLVEPGTVPLIVETRLPPWAAIPSSDPIEYLVTVNPSADPPHLDFLGGVPMMREFVGKASRPAPQSRGIYRIIDGTIDLVSCVKRDEPANKLERPTSFRVHLDSQLVRDRFYPADPLENVVIEGQVVGDVPTPSEDLRSDTGEGRSDTGEMADLLGKWRLQSIEGDVLNKDMVPRIDIGPILDLGVPKDGPIPLMVGVHHGAVGHGIGPSFPTSEYPIYLVDPTATPPRIERSTREGRESLPRSRGVYRIEGDRLTLQFVDPDVPHPSGFERTGPDSTRYIYRRINFSGVPGVVPTPAERGEGDRFNDQGQGANQSIDSLLGTWVSTQESDGAYFALEILRPNPSERLGIDQETHQLIFRLRMQANDQIVAESLMSQLVATLDTSATPTQINWFDPADSESIENHLPSSEGIYRLEGDTLTIHMNGHNRGRPTTFEGELEQGSSYLRVFRRSELDLFSPTLNLHTLRREALTRSNTPRSPTESPAPQTTEIDQRLSALEAKLDRLLELLESPDR